MEVVAETERRCTIEFLTINSHIKFRGSKVLDSIVRKFRCIQSTLPQVSLYVCTFYTNYNFDRSPHYIERTSSVSVNVLTMYVWAQNVCACLKISFKLYLLLSTKLRISFILNTPLHFKTISLKPPSWSDQVSIVRNTHFFRLGQDVGNMFSVQVLGCFW